MQIKWIAGPVWATVIISCGEKMAPKPVLTELSGEVQLAITDQQGKITRFESWVQPKSNVYVRIPHIDGQQLITVGQGSISEHGKLNIPLKDIEIPNYKNNPLIPTSGKNISCTTQVNRLSNPDAKYAYASVALNKTDDQSILHSYQHMDTIEMLDGIPLNGVSLIYANQETTVDLQSHCEMTNTSNKTTYKMVYTCEFTLLKGWNTLAFYTKADQPGSTAILMTNGEAPKAWLLPKQEVGDK